MNQQKSNTTISTNTTTKTTLTNQSASKFATSTRSQSLEQNRLNKKPELKLVDVVISGVTYPIQCPADEVQSLQKASDFINQFISDIRKQAPTLNHENLLVLCCLNLYEQIDSQQLQQKHHQLENERMQALINKISQDANSILPH